MWLLKFTDAIPLSLAGKSRASFTYKSASGAAFLNDAPRQQNGGFDPNTGFPSTQRQDQRQNIWGFFIQDDLKLRPNLTVNLGLRWSYFAPLYSKQNNMFRAIPGPGANYLTGLVVHRQNAWDAQENNF